jgi:hypothetical protein
VKLIIDCTIGSSGIPGSFHFLDTGDADEIMMSSPDPKGGQITSLAWLQYMSAHPEIHTQAGWDVESSLPGLPQGTTRWQALVAQANSKTASPSIQKLGLK